MRAEIRHFHLFCGLGGGAKGFNRAQARVGTMKAEFRCIGGIDSDAAAVRDFERAAGCRGTVLDLFDREQYIAWHGHAPPSDWREATPADVQRAAGFERPHIIFTSPPCKGFSGLLNSAKAASDRYAALNRLTTRGIWLALEAWKDDPPEFFLLENVPRIATRGLDLLDQIEGMLRAYGYAVARTTHDCGELGGLAQTRKRFLLVARHQAKVPPFLYEPTKRPLRAVGDILGRMPLPGDPGAGPMHRLPNLQWRTWVRLAFVEAGKDWRSLEKLRVVDGMLADYGIVPEDEYRNGVLGVRGWDDYAHVVAGENLPYNGPFSVADPLVRGAHHRVLGVAPWAKTSGTIAGASRPQNGTYAVADPRPNLGDNSQWNKFAVTEFGDHARTVTGANQPQRGALSVADVRFPQSEHWHDGQQLGVVEFGETAGTITGQRSPAQGKFSVADPRPPAEGRFNNVYRVVRFDDSSPAVTAGGGPTAGGLAVGDPRPGWNRHGNNLAVQDWKDPSRTIIAGGKGVQGGWLSIADPRVGMRSDREAYKTAGHYGVTPWGGESRAITGSVSHDNGPGNVADPRCEAIALPTAKTQGVFVIRALDGTWHRPFTTLELAALQSLVTPEECWGFMLDGASDSAHRERIGNAVPPEAAEAIGGVIGQTLLLAWSGETFVLGSTPIWVRPIAIALSVRGA